MKVIIRWLDRMRNSMKINRTKKSFEICVASKRAATTILYRKQRFFPVIRLGLSFLPIISCLSFLSFSSSFLSSLSCIITTVYLFETYQHIIDNQTLYQTYIKSHYQRTYQTFHCNNSSENGMHHQTCESLWYSINLLSWTNNLIQSFNILIKHPNQSITARLNLMRYDVMTKAVLSISLQAISFVLQHIRYITQSVIQISCSVYSINQYSHILVMLIIA